MSGTAGKPLPSSHPGATVDSPPLRVEEVPGTRSGLPWRRGVRLNMTVGVWMVLVLVSAVLARQSGSVPGLYYDEAIFGGAAKDFLTGRTHGRHLPFYVTVDLFGR